MRANLIVVALVLAATKVSASPAPSSTVLTPRGLGGVHVGMYLNAVASSMGNFDLFEMSGHLGAERCYAIQSKVLDANQGITFVGIGSPAVQRVDVRRLEESEPGSDKLLASRVRTREGIVLGDFESRINGIYSGSTEFRPPAKLSPTYRVVELRKEPYGYAFVVSDGVIVELRSGHVAALKHQESCE
jgi:hypothetical protein